METLIRFTSLAKFMAFDKPIKIETIMQFIMVRNRVIWRAVLQFLGTQYINCPNSFRSNVDIVAMFIVVVRLFYVDIDLIAKLCCELLMNTRWEVWTLPL